MRSAVSRLCAAALSLLICAPAFPASAAEPRRERFDIEAQPLSRALLAYARQTGEQVVFFSDVGRGRQSEALFGVYTREEALQQLLQNTGLTYRRLNAKTIAISAGSGGEAKDAHGAQTEDNGKPASANAPNVQPAQVEQARSPLEEPPAPPASREAVLFGLGEVVVTGTASKERTKFESSVAISTFDADEISLHAPASTADVISAVPGFWVESTAGTTQGNVFARGIIQDGGYRYVGLMEDGIPIYPVFELSFYNPDQFVRVDETLARVEALRGGTAPIFTSGAVGGVVNFVTKAPGREPQGTFRFTAGDYSLYRADVSWSGPVTDTWGLAAGGYYRRSHGIRDPGYTADDGGQIRLKLVRALEHGDLELFGKYINDRSLFVVPIPLQGNASDPDGVSDKSPGEYALQSEDLARAGLPPSAAEVGLQNSDLRDGIHPDLFTAGGKLTFHLNGAVTLTNLLRFTDGEVRFNGIFPGAAPVIGSAFAASLGVAPDFSILSSGAAYDPGLLVQNHGHWVINKEYEALQNDARLNFTAHTHDVALGLYIARYSMADRWSLGNQLLMDVSSRPSRLHLPGATDPNGFTSYSTFNLLADYDATAWAVYLSDEWQLTDALRLDFGMRYDNQEIDASISDGITVDLDGNPATSWDNQTALAGSSRTRSRPQLSHTSYSVGFNHALSLQHAVFGHYTDAAKLRHFDDIRGNAPDDDGVTNIELGYKTSLGTIAFFATLFQTRFDNVFFNDILADGTQVQRIAETRTRGLELEGVYQPVAPLSVTFSITQQDPKYSRYAVNDRNTGGRVADLSHHRIRRIPETMIRVSPTYRFAGNRGRAFMTYSYFGDRYSNDENTIGLPSFNKLDAGVMYNVTPSLTLQLSGDNLTDEVGLTEGNPRTDIGAGGLGALYNARPLFGRSFQLSGTMRF